MSVPYLAESDVRALVSLPEVINALQTALPREHDQGAVNIRKSMTIWDERSSAHTLGAVDPTLGLCAFKNWVNTPTGATAVLSLFDAESGALIAVMDAAYLGTLRTAGVAGLATRVLASEQADRLVVCGSGRQALRQVEAVHAVRPLRSVTVWSPTESRRRMFAREIEETLSVKADAIDSLADALASDPPILTLVTRARQPFLSEDMLGGAPHVNAMGAVLPAYAEMTAGFVASAQTVVVDSIENARQASTELSELFESTPARVSSLGALLRGSGGDPPQRTGPTLFKAMGMGLSDLAAAAVVAQNADLIGDRP